MKAVRLLSENIQALLRARKQSQHDLAQWCRHSDVWLSYFLSGKREIQLADLDRIADFFGIATYQLFQPGISPLTERRVYERRSVPDRRIGHTQREMLGVAAELNRVRTGKAHDEAAAIPAARIRALIATFERELDALHRLADAGRQTSLAGGEPSDPPPRHRTPRGSHRASREKPDERNSA